MTQMVTASDINHAIKGKYYGEQWRVWFEVSQSTGHSSGRRADAVVMNIWPSKDFQIHVFEVKISRSDFKSEMADLSKHKAIGKYADYFWLACPVGLVDKSEVPENWGLMELTKSGLRIKKQAPAQASPSPLDRGFAASLLRAGESLTEKRIFEIANERAVTLLKGESDRLERKFKMERSSDQRRLQKTEEWIRGFEEVYGVKPPMHYPPERMAARIKVAEGLDMGRWNALANQAVALADLVDKIQQQSETQ